MLCLLAASVFVVTNMVTASKKPLLLHAVRHSYSAFRYTKYRSQRSWDCTKGRTAVTTFLDHLEKSRHLEDNWKKNVLER